MGNKQSTKQKEQPQPHVRRNSDGQNPSRERLNHQPMDPNSQSRKVSDSQISMRAALENMSPVDMMPRRYSGGTEARARGPSSISLLAINPDSVSDIMCVDVPIQVFIYEVYDGDTVHFLMLSGGNEGTVIKLALRIIGLDTPEIRGGAGHLAEERIAGEMARNRLAEIINARISKEPRIPRPHKQSLTTIIIHGWDKYGGRALGEILMPDGRSVTEILIAEGYGRPYNGEKKLPWTKEDLTRPPFNLM